MSMPICSVSWNFGDGIFDQFPVGLRVLLVDDDPTCLMILEKMLRNCLYQVTKCNRAEIALLLLRERKNAFDIVLSDVHMPDMDGFKLLEHIGLEMDLPVIMMSADDSKNVVMKGVTHGACDYLIKPVRIEALRNIWQHVVRRRKDVWKDIEQSEIIEDGARKQKQSEDTDFSSSTNEENWRNSKKQNREEDEAEEDRDDTSALKKPRVVWSVELHQQFVAAVNQLGTDKAVPKKILDLMNVAGLSRENVASHLQLLHNGNHPIWSTHNCSDLVQKYRLYLRRLSALSPHHSALINSFLGPPEANFGSMSSLNGLDLQALAVSGQLPSPSLAALQVVALSRPNTKSGISMPFADQRNLFDFGTPKLRFGEPPPHSGNSNMQTNLLHGIPTTMELKQLTNLQQSQPKSQMLINAQANSCGSQSSPLLVQMSQQQSRPQVLSDSNDIHLSSGMATGCFARNGEVEKNAGGEVYKQIFQPNSMVDLSTSCKADFLGNSFAVGNNSGVSSFTSKEMLHEDINSDMRGPKGFTPSYDISNELLHQHRSHDWELGNVGPTFDASRRQNKQGSMNVLPSVLVQQEEFSSFQNGGLNRITSIVSSPNTGQQHNTLLMNSQPIVNSERVPEINFQNTVFPEQFIQEDLISALLQQQEGIGPSMNDFRFDGYSLDDLPI